jgi:putative zinc finger/helix-turn-helix YgiT family protein
MKCFQCEDGTLREGPTTLVGERNGEQFAIAMEGLECDSCGFATLDNRQSSEFTQRTSDAYRAAHGMVTGAQMRAYREQFDMNQQEFAEYLGVSSASVKRWELGQIQDKAMDTLIRLKTDLSAAQRNCEELQAQAQEQNVSLAGVQLELIAGDSMEFDEMAQMRMEPVEMKEPLFESKEQLIAA